MVVTWQDRQVVSTVVSTSEVSTDHCPPDQLSYLRWPHIGGRGWNLYVHLEYSFTNQSCSEECPEWNQEMTARYSGQVKERVWNLSERVSVK